MDANAAIDRKAALSLAFMQAHPVQAARVLEALPATASASVFERAPARIGAGVMAAMLPRQASCCVAELSDARALELLVAMNMQATVSMLRYLPRERRNQLVASLPAASALASTVLLGFDEDSVGAWADPSVIMLPSVARATDALDRVRQTEVSHPAVFVTDDARRLLGLVPVPALLRAPEAATLATLMQRAPAVLMALAPLAGASAHPGWALASALPVVESGDRLVGVLTHDAMTRALQRNQGPEAHDVAREIGLPGMVVRSYWQTVVGLVGVCLPLTPSVPPVWPKQGGNDER
jgi:magnesium transporter